MLNSKKILMFSISIILAISTFGYPTVASATEVAKPTISYIPIDEPVSTSIAVSQKGWSQSDNVIIADSSQFPDALAGSSFAMEKDCPIIYAGGTDKLDLPNETDKWDELLRLKAKRVYILGGVAAIRQSIEDDLTSKGMEVIRLSGKNRYETAKAVGDEVIKINNSKTVFITCASNFPDALSVSTFAGQLKAPIMLTSKGNLNSVTQNALKEWSTKTVYLAGGTAAISQHVEDTLTSMNIKVIRISGQNRYDTSKKVIQYFKPDTDSLTITTGTDFHSALVGSVYGYKTNHPVMLFDKNVTDSIKEFAWACNDLVVIGTGFSEADIKPLPGGTIAGYKLIPNTPSLKKYPTDMINLQSIAKLLPEEDIMWNDINFFDYDAASSKVTYQNCITYSSISLWGAISSNPTAIKLLDSILYDLLGEKDATQLASIAKLYNSTVQDNDAMEAKYFNYQLTASKLHQFKIYNEGTKVYLYIK
ncbi:cell wall-binding repeat-containing protein [Clostridium sp.]|jgi:putative cell wall-binding protein|uniref:cell wall-binding repeat-containing protein n=1 Tax=Clostridium sp. TaxID=1506 RepID=UPI003EF05A8C